MPGESRRIFRASYVYNPIHFLDNSVILYMVSDYQDKRSEVMEAYTNFAEVYDTFMDNVPYDEWADYIERMLKEYQISDGLVLELGCGTGSMTELLSAKL